MRYYIIAGEKSGDIYAGRLIKALQAVDSQAVVRGWGGGHMQEAGAELVVHYRELAVMGLRFLPSLRRLHRYVRFCKWDLQRFAPDAVILIDYAGFNLRMARFAKRKHFKTFYYIPPKVWAWHAQRIHGLKAYVDQIFAIFPFEKEFYARHGCDNVTYVGFPLVDEVAAYKSKPNWLVSQGLDGRPIIALLPGSRQQEIEKMLPHMVALVKLLPSYQFVVAALSELSGALYNTALGRMGVAVVYDQTQDVLAHAHVAVVTAGTASLEALYFKVPQVVVYQTDPWTYTLAKCFVQVRYLSLVNILAGRQVVDELIQNRLSTPRLLRAVEPLLLGERRALQLAAYEPIRKQLGDGGVASRVVQGILSYV